MRNRFLPVLPALTALLLGACSAAPGADPASEEDGPIATGEQALTSNEKAAYEFFVTKGLTGEQSAAIVGNLIQESNVLPSSVQPGGPGRGIAQWSVGGRWDTAHSDNVVAYAASRGASKTDLTLQLEFIWYELQTFSGFGLAKLRGTTTISAATVAFQTDFEKCGTCEQSKRISYAQQVFAAYGSGTSGGSATCYSSTLGKTMPDNACVQSRADSQWYQCDNGKWVDRATDPMACSGVYPL